VKSLNKSNGEFEWSYELNNGGYTSGGLTFENDVLYCSLKRSSSLFTYGQDSVLVALNTNNGQEIWRVEDTSEFSSMSYVTVDSNQLLFLNSGKIKALNKEDGELIWQSQDIEGSTLNLTTDNGKIYFQTNEALYCLDGSDGSQVWKIDVIQDSSISPFIDSNYIYTANNTNYLKIDKTSGELVWDDNNFYGINSSPLVVGDFSYFSQNGLRCINNITGNEVWNYRAYTGSISSYQETVHFDEPVIYDVQSNTSYYTIESGMKN